MGLIREREREREREKTDSRRSCFVKGFLKKVLVDCGDGGGDDWWVCVFIRGTWWGLVDKRGL